MMDFPSTGIDPDRIPPGRLLAHLLEIGAIGVLPSIPVDDVSELDSFMFPCSASDVSSTIPTEPIQVGLNSYQDERFYKEGEMVVHTTMCDVCGYVHAYGLVPTTRLVPNGYRVTKDPRHPLL